MTGKTVQMERIVIRSPEECSPADRAAFSILAAKGEEVDPEDIKRGTERAAALLWICGDAGLVAVAAVKRPFDSYKRGVFDRAGVPKEAPKFALEFGYLFVEEAHRGRGYGPSLVQKAIELKGREPIYATTRSDNIRMQEILRENDFVTIGSDYPSKRDLSRLLRVLVRPTAAEAT